VSSRTENVESVRPARAELGALACIVVAAWLLRSAWANELVTPTHHAALLSTLSVHELASERSLSETLAYWWSLLSSFQGLSLVELSAAVLPVNLAVQWFTGPVLGFPTLVGAVWGTAAVVLAWAVGRRLGGGPLGLVFAALVAVSPVQIVWSRLGGLYVTAVTQVLAALWLALACVRRRSVVVAMIAGLACWATLYGYYAARVAIPVCIWAILTWPEPRARWTIRLALLAGWLVPWVGGYLLWGKGLLETFWPLVGFQFFPNPETHAVFGASLAAASRSVRDTFRLLFVSGRAGPFDLEGGWDIAHGGAIPLAVTVLGAIGLVAALRDLRRFQLGVVLLVASLLPAVLSAAELRRLVVFDMAWQLVAARGVLAVGAVLTRGAVEVQAALTALGVTALGCWSAIAILMLTAGSSRELAAIPFGSGVQGESGMCVGCVWRMRRWQQAVASGQAVVVFDNDPVRDGRQFHLRTAGYAQLAALAGGHPDGAISFYQVLRNRRDRWTQVPEPLWKDGTWVDFLRHDLSAPWVREVLWYFANPTPLERHAMAGLERAGGRVTRSKFPYDVADTLGEDWQKRLTGEVVEVVTPRDELDAALAAVERALAPAAPDEPAPLAVTRLGSRELPEALMDLVGAVDERGRVTWAGIGPASWEVNGQTRAAPLLSSVVARNPTAGRTVPEFLAITQSDRTLSWGGDQMDRDVALQRLLPAGHRCAAAIGDHWFVVDAATGELRSDTDVRWLPARAWAGIAAAGGDRVVLASTASELVVADVATRQVTGVWPVPLWPGPRMMYGECSTLLVGDGWYATYDYTSGRAAVVGVGGTLLGAFDVRALVGGESTVVDAVGAAGDQVAVAYASPRGRFLDTLRVTITADAPKPRGAARPGAEGRADPFAASQESGSQ